MSNLTRLDAKAAEERFEHLGYNPRGETLPPGVIRQHRLPRGSEFVSDLTLPSSQLYAFKISTGETARPFTYALVGRDLGDVTWPIFLEGQAEAARQEVAQIIRDGFAEVQAWLDAAEQAAAPAEEPDEEFEVLAPPKVPDNLGMRPEFRGRR